MLLIANAIAQDVSGATQEPSAFAGMLPLLLMVAVFYFLLLRPQQKKYKAHQQMVNSVAKGDKVVTSGGLVGKVAKVDADGETLQVDIADGVTVTVVRAMIASVQGKEQPAAAAATPAAKAKAKAKKAA